MRRLARAWQDTLRGSRVASNKFEIHRTFAGIVKRRRQMSDLMPGSDINLSG
jgi:hypothetical protein